MIIGLFDNDINAANELLFQACQNGNITDVETALARHANIEAIHPEFGSPLMSAAYNGHENIVRRLLLSGANANGRSNNGLTALMGAQTLPIFMDLVNYGADINATTPNGGLSVLMLAINSATYDYFTAYPIINYLLESGVDINHRADNGLNAQDLCLRTYPQLALLIEASSQRNMTNAFRD